jgi:hypothetical protein
MKRDDIHARVAHGGKAVYGARLGILMLEARFPRIPGDMGHAGTWPFPVLYKVVKGASPQRVVAENAEGLLPSFVEAAKELEALGADGITTNCGFLSPIKSSWRRDRAGGDVEPDAGADDPEHATGRKAGRGYYRQRGQPDARSSYRHRIDPSLPVVGTDGGREFTRVLIGNELTMDGRSRAGHPRCRRCFGPQTLRHWRHSARVHEHGALRTALRDRLGVPVYDIYSFMLWFHAGWLPAISAIPIPAGPWRER